MSQFYTTGTRPDTADGAIAQHLRVKTPGALEVAGASDVAIGTMEFRTTAAGPATVRLRSAQGTKKMVANGAITKGATAFAAASGKVSGGGTVREGVALESATADNDIIEVMDAPHVDLVASSGITLPTVEFNGATTVNKLIVPDDLADALSIVEGSNKYLTVVTTNAGEKVQVNYPFELTSANANALTVGRLGAVTPALHVDASTATSITGLKVKSAAAGGGVAISAVGETNVNMTVDAAGSGTVTLGTTSTGNIAANRRLTTTDGVTAGTARVVGGRAYSLAEAGTVLTDTTDQTVMGSYTIPASTLKDGSVVKIRYFGQHLGQDSTNTLQVRLRIGPSTLSGELLIDHGAVDPTENHFFEGEFTLVARDDPGATVGCVGVGSRNENGVAASGDTRVNAVKATFDLATDGALLVEVTGQQSAAHADNQARLDLLVVEIL